MSSKHQDINPSQQQKLTKQNKYLVHRYYSEIWNHGNLAVLSELFSTNHLIHNGPLGLNVSTGPQGVRQLVSTFRAAIPDLQVSVDDLVAQWNKAAVRFTLQGPTAVSC